MTAREEFTAEVTRSFRAVFRGIGHGVALEWLDLELTMAQVRALMTLSRAGPTTVSALGHLLGIQQPAASHAVDKLVRLGFAERYEDQEDRRRTLVRLTPRAEALADRLREGKRELIRGWLAALDDSQLAALAYALRPVVAVVGTDDAGVDHSAAPAPVGPAIPPEEPVR